MNTIALLFFKEHIIFESGAVKPVELTMHIPLPFSQLISVPSTS
jgi:hypothetical protein